MRDQQQGVVDCITDGAQTTLLSRHRASAAVLVVLGSRCGMLCIRAKPRPPNSRAARADPSFFQVEGHEDACHYRRRHLYPDCHYCGPHRQVVRVYFICLVQTQKLTFVLQRQGLIGTHVQFVGIKPNLTRSPIWTTDTLPSTRPLLLLFLFSLFDVTVQPETICHSVEHDDTKSALQGVQQDVYHRGRCCCHSGRARRPLDDAEDGSLAAGASVVCWLPLFEACEEDHGGGRL